MIRRSTWISLLLLAALIGFAFYWTNRKTQLAASATPTAAAGAPTPLFALSEGSVTDVKLQDTTGKSVEITRNGSGEWVLKAPTEAPADQAAAEAAATQVASLKVLSTIELGLDVVGLDKPSYTGTFVFSGGKTHKLEIGAETPIQDGYYARLDGGPVQVVDKPGIDALLRLLEQPPYVATATPAVTETETATEAPPATQPATTPEGTSTAPAATEPAATTTP